jgi:hypothetical protein
VRAAERKAPELLAPVAPVAAPALNSGTGSVAAAVSGAVGMASVGGGPGNAGPVNAGLINAGLDLSEPMPPEVKDPMFKLKMLAAFATGVMVDRIISGLFQ